MAKLSFLGEVVCAALFTSAILWQETSSSGLGLFSSTVTEETTTTNDRGSDGCVNVTCPLRKHCVLDSENSPECVCNDICYLIYDPVCGSDGQTYGNDCFLGVEACKSNTNITIEHRGSCNDSSTCDGTTCPPGKSCQLDSEGRSDCLCNLFCTKIYDPVCGSDGKTYGNECMLEAEACRTNTNITTQYKGICNDSFTCDDVTCPSRTICKLNSEGRPECACRNFCPRIYVPVCGSDGKTYGSGCWLRVVACSTDTNITVLHRGRCNDSCTGFECPYYGRCVVDSDDRPTCVCRLGCPEIYSPVCGSDNNTYDNECLLQAQACQTNTSITVLHEGECAGKGFSCNGITCPPFKSCELNSEGQPECICDMVCTMQYDPVCGSDGKTYGNDCTLSLKACQTNNSLTVAHDGECETDHPTKKPKCPGNKEEC